MEIPVTEVAPNTDAVIVAIQGGYGMQARLRSLGLVEGRSLRKVSHVGRRGPVIVLVDRMQVAVGYGIARRVLVRVEVSPAAGPAD